MNIDSQKQWLISQPRLIAALDVTKAKFYRMREADPTFPVPIKDGPARQAAAHYLVSEVEAWLAARAAARVSL